MNAKTHIALFAASLLLAAALGAGITIYVANNGRTELSDLRERASALSSYLNTANADIIGAQVTASELRRELSEATERVVELENRAVRAENEVAIVRKSLEGLGSGIDEGEKLAGELTEILRGVQKRSGTEDK